MVFIVTVRKEGVDHVAGRCRSWSEASFKETHLRGIHGPRAIIRVTEYADNETATAEMASGPLTSRLRAAMTTAPCK